MLLKWIYLFLSACCIASGCYHDSNHENTIQKSEYHAEQLQKPSSACALLTFKNKQVSVIADVFNLINTQITDFYLSTYPPIQTPYYALFLQRFLIKKQLQIQ